jgi:hypothetical protein
MYTLESELFCRVVIDLGDPTQRFDWRPASRQACRSDPQPLKARSDLYGCIACTRCATSSGLTVLLCCMRLSRTGCGTGRLMGVFTSSVAALAVVKGALVRVQCQAVDNRLVTRR